MTLAEFLHQTQDTGEIIFDSSEPLALDTTAEADAIQQLLAIDERRRLEVAHEAPRLRVEPATWAAQLMFRVSQFLVYREVPAERIKIDLTEACPGEPGPEQSYSVDLTMHRLPELTLRAIHIASADPLVEQLLRLAWKWPLSSVGVSLDVPSDGPTPDLTAILSNAALKQLYVDRIFTTGDTSRLHDPEIAAAVADAIGDHSKLGEGLLGTIHGTADRRG